MEVIYMMFTVAWTIVKTIATTPLLLMLAVLGIARRLIGKRT